MKKAFTDRFLRSLKPAQPGSRVTVWDAALPNFGVRVTDKGHASFFVMRRPRGLAKPVRVVLGAYPATSLADARERARAAINDLTAGVHPGEREAQRQRAELARRANLFENVASDFISRHVSKRRTAGAITQRIKRELEARWAKRPVTDITRAEVIRMVEEIVDSGRPEAARQTLIYCRRLFNWAIVRDIYGLEHSPADRVNAIDLIGTKKARQRVLTDAEIRLIWQATEGPAARTYPYGMFVRLLLVLGCRRGELAGAVWDEIDFDKAVWMLSGERTKNSEPHVIPLPALAIDLIQAIPKSQTPGPFLFSNSFGEKPLVDFAWVKGFVDRRIVELAPPGIAPWTMHDLRRTMRTGLATLGVPPHIAELCLGHKQRGIAAVYDQHRYEREKRDALEQWTTRLTLIVNPSETKNVVLLKEHATRT